MAYLKMYGGRIQIGKTIDIYSAAVDTIYYMENGVAVTVGTTDATGKLTVNKSALPNGTYTLYSTVAKDPSNLSNAYSKSVTVDNNTEEIYLMPDGAVYWYGYEPYAFSMATADCDAYLELDVSEQTNYRNLQTKSQSTSTNSGSAYVTTDYIDVSSYNTLKIYIKEATLTQYNASSTESLCCINNGSYVWLAVICYKNAVSDTIISGDISTYSSIKVGTKLQKQYEKMAYQSYYAIWLE